VCNQGLGGFGGIGGFIDSPLCSIDIYMIDSMILWMMISIFCGILFVILLLGGAK
jgi:hypothetical protein